MRNGNALLYLMGVPGSGKTTLLHAVLGDLPQTIVKPGNGDFRPPHTVYPGGAQIGYAEGIFGGTDRLSMNIQPRVLDWMGTAPFPRLIAEGDRLCNASFFAAVIQMGWALSVVWLDTPPILAGQRREARGTRQNRSWVAGRITKIGRLQSWADAGWRLDGSLPVSELATQLKQHPIVRGLRSG